MTKARRFRDLLTSDRLEFLMEAHNGLSAKIVEQTGFKGIWASGLSLSAAWGVRDNNEASWTQVLEAVEFMSDATTVPILLDGDTGYGNFNNIRRVVHKLEQRGVAAICIEDKLFPKTNSFIRGEKQPLADQDEFAGKIKAAKDARGDPDFSVVARLEGFIAGWGLEEVLRRAEAYWEAGADALLVHSRKTTPEEILAFAAAWDRPCPIIIVPTSYYGTPVEVFEQAGIRLVIWANHNLRAAINAMQAVSQTIFRERSLLKVEEQVAPLKEVFRLQNAEELIMAEERYLPKTAGSVRAIVLAASRGEEMGALTVDKPKCMIPVGGVPFLHKLVSRLRGARIKDVIAVRGYAKEQVHAPGVHFVDNDRYEGTGELLSLYQARSWLEGEVVLSFGDILFRDYILKQLLGDEDPIVMVADAAWQRRPHAKGVRDFIEATRPYSMKYDETDPFLREIDPALPAGRIHGEWIGLLKANAAGTALLVAALEHLHAGGGFEQMRLDHLFAELLARDVPVKIMYITGHWLDVDGLEDLDLAHSF